MFKFGFSSDQNENSDSESSDKSLNDQWYKSEEIVLENKIYNDLIKQFDIKEIRKDDFIIKSVSPKEVALFLQNISGDSSVIKAEQNHSDLLPAIYEGGLKVWECTFDLLDFIIKENLDLTDKKVLDLGCGSGLIGILTHIKGAQCYFQDYNTEVIKWYTIPNFLLNKGNPERCKFYSGDWQSFLETVNVNFDTDEKKFDYIFTSETIYNSKNHIKLLNIFKNLLKLTGIIYLAAKDYYFGVGGGITEFQDLLKKDGTFSFTTSWSCDSGVKRTILKIFFKGR